MDGFIYLWRKSINTEAFKNPELWQMWTWCLMKAASSPYFASLKVGKGNTTIKVKRGQFIYGRNRAAEELGCSPSSARNRLDKLVKMGNLSIVPTNQYSIVTICNYEYYQNPNNYESLQPCR